MKKDDFYARTQRPSLWTLSFTIPLLMLLTIFEVVNPRNNLLVKLIFLAELVLLLAAGVFAFFRYKSRLKRFEQLRERALQEDSSLLASQQPVPNPYSLPIPTTIKRDQSRGGIIFLGLLIACILFIPFVSGVVFGSSDHNHGNSNLLPILLIILAGAVLALLIAFVLLFFIMRSQLIYTIVVDEQGISSTYRGITSTIKWSDARLFAVLNPERPSTMRFYELSNEHTVVGWVDMPARTLFQRKENKAFAEYRHKIHALLSLIAARTGLPLYDLSQSSGSNQKV